MGDDDGEVITIRRVRVSFPLYFPKFFSIYLSLLIPDYFYENCRKSLRKFQETLLKFSESLIKFYKLFVGIFENFEKTFEKLLRGISTVCVTDLFSARNQQMDLKPKKLYSPC